MDAKNNPFASRHIDRLKFRFIDTTQAFVWDRFKDLNYKAAIVGPEGSGKTTLLFEFEKILTTKGYTVTTLRFDDLARKLTKGTIYRIKQNCSGHCAFLVDGVEQLSWIDKKRLFFVTHKAKALLITTHFAGVLPTLFQTGTSSELLGELVQSLTGSTHMFSQQQIVDLFERHSGNIRHALRELYDIWAEIS